MGLDTKVFRSVVRSEVPADALGTQVTRAAVQRLDMVLKVSVDSKKGH
ncbi:hypothetical protein N8152_01230 [bacterium]|nr:hypothetical protein [bacterium]